MSRTSTRPNRNRSMDTRKPGKRENTATDLFILALLIGLVYLAFHISKRYELKIGLEISLAGGFIIFAFLLWKILSLYLNANEYSERKDFVDLHAKILGSAALVISLLFTWQGIKNNQETSEKTQKLTLQNLENTERRQIEDRYSKALEQLGSKEREARLGAIYSLGKIASDSIIWKENAINAAEKSSDKERLSLEIRDFHWEIMQTLASYIRGNAPKTAKISRSSQENRTDIQAALNVLAWRSRSFQNGENQRLELYGTDLSGAVLKATEPMSSCISPNKQVLFRQLLIYIEAGTGRTSYEGAHFEGAQLYDAQFIGAQMRGINFDHAILKGADFTGAVMPLADLTDADLTDANLDKADLGQATVKPYQIMDALNWQTAKRLPKEVCEDLQRNGVTTPKGCK